MSEIIFPSEVLPEIDWENPLIANTGNEPVSSLFRDAAQLEPLTFLYEDPSVVARD